MLEKFIATLPNVWSRSTSTTQWHRIRSKWKLGSLRRGFDNSSSTPSKRMSTLKLVWAPKKSARNQKLSMLAEKSSKVSSHLSTNQWPSAGKLRSLFASRDATRRARWTTTEAGRKNCLIAETESNWCPIMKPWIKRSRNQWGSYRLKMQTMYFYPRWLAIFSSKWRSPVLIYAELRTLRFSQFKLSWTSH